jgi:hypothetical protein
LGGTALGVSPGSGAQPPSQREDDDTLDQTEPEEGGRVTAGSDDGADRDHGQRCAGAEPGGGQADGEAATVGKPFDRIADAGGIDGAGAGAGQHRPEIEQAQRSGHRVDDPGDRHQHAAEGDHQLRPGLRAKLIDDPSFERRQPSLERDEDAEGDLDIGDGPVMGSMDRMNKQRPTILQVGDHHHADDGEDQLCPAVRLRAAGRCCGWCYPLHCVHLPLLPPGVFSLPSRGYRKRNAILMKWLLMTTIHARAAHNLSD